jgi:hypothetical protein
MSMDDGMNVLDHAHRHERSHDGQFDDRKAGDGRQSEDYRQYAEAGRFVSWLDNFELWSNIATQYLSL